MRCHRYEGLFDLLRTPTRPRRRTQAERPKGWTARGPRSRRWGKVARDLHTLLEDLTNHVVRGELETSRGAVASQLVNTRIRLLEFERRVREQDEILARIEQLEQAQEQKGGRQCGA